jgi:hypothetical protein
MLRCGFHAAQSRELRPPRGYGRAQDGVLQQLPRQPAGGRQGEIGRRDAVTPGLGDAAGLRLLVAGVGHRHLGQAVA